MSQYLNIFATFFRKKWRKKSRAGQISYHSAKKPSKFRTRRRGASSDNEICTVSTLRDYGNFPMRAIRKTIYNRDEI